MRNIWEELWHNLRSGAAVNLILILLFALFFWQGTVISSYFADITDSPVSSSQKYEDYCYYSLADTYSASDEASRIYQSQDPAVTQNMDRTYRELHEELGEQYFAYSNYNSGLEGTIVLPLDAPDSKINTLAKQINNIFVKNGLNPKIPTGTSYGVFLFQEESEQTMWIFLAAGIVMAILAISGICMAMIVKLNRNLNRYGIEIMNGQSIRTVLAAFLLEMLLVMGAGLLLNIWQFINLIHSNFMFLTVLLMLAGTAALIVTLVFVSRLRKVDIEEIIKSQE